MHPARVVRIELHRAEHDRGASLEAVLVSEIVNRKDLLMGERRDRFRLLEADQRVGIGRDGRRSTLIATSRSSFLSRARAAAMVAPPAVVRYKGGMIIRRAESKLQLITQPDHAALALRIMRQWDAARTFQSRRGNDPSSTRSSITMTVGRRRMRN